MIQTPKPKLKLKSKLNSLPKPIPKPTPNSLIQKQIYNIFTGYKYT